MPRPLQSQAQRRSLCAHHQAFSLGSKMTNTTHVNEGMKVLHKDIKLIVFKVYRTWLIGIIIPFHQSWVPVWGAEAEALYIPRAPASSLLRSSWPPFYWVPFPPQTGHTLSPILENMQRKHWTGEQLTSKGRGKQEQCYWNASVSIKSPAWRTPCAEVDLSLSPCCILVPSPSWPAESEPGDWWDSFPGHILGWSAAVGVTD